LVRSINPYRLAWSIKVTRLFGIDIKVHLVFILFVFLICLWNVQETGSLMTGFQTFIRVSLLFLCVLFHEIGHSLAARRLGVEVIDITLWPLGGLARLGVIPEIPSVELRIALAGPAVNFAFIILIVALDSIFMGTISYPRLFEPFSPYLNLVEFLVLVNAFMGTLNLLPAFPLDGGRILRALAAIPLPYLKATRIAVTTGKIFAFTGFVCLALNGMIFSSLWLTLICLFIYWAGNTELRAVRAREFLKVAAGRRGRPAGPENPNVIDAEVISSYTPGSGEPEEGEASRYPRSGADIKRHMDQTEREFIEMMERLKRNGGN